MVPPRLHLITDDDVLAEPAFLQTAALVLEECGSDVAVHVRGHATSAATLFALTERLVAMASATDAWVVVNDRVDIALGAGAQGVQLGARSLSLPDVRRLAGVGRRIGYSAHSPEEAAFAAADGADWVLMGTIFATASHPDVEPAGLDALRACARAAATPVIAIGGITPERVAQVKATRAHGVAVLGGVWRAAEPAQAARRYRDAVRTGWKKKGAVK